MQMSENSSERLINLPRKESCRDGIQTKVPLSKPMLISSLMGANNDEGLEALGPTEEWLPPPSSQPPAPAEMQVQHGESFQLSKGSRVTGFNAASPDFAIFSIRSASF